MIDTHLKHLGDLSTVTFKLMTLYRQLFISVDNALINLENSFQSGHRNIDIARTKLEEALMHTMKDVAILGEKPTNENGEQK